MPYVRLPSLGVWQWEEEYPDNLVLNLGFDGSNYTGLGKTETQLLEGVHMDPCVPSHRGEKQ